MIKSALLAFFDRDRIRGASPVRLAWRNEGSVE